MPLKSFNIKTFVLLNKNVLFQLKTWVLNKDPIVWLTVASHQHLSHPPLGGSHLRTVRCTRPTKSFKLSIFMHSLVMLISYKNYTDHFGFLEVRGLRLHKCQVAQVSGRKYFTSPGIFNITIFNDSIPGIKDSIDLYRILKGFWTVSSSQGYNTFLKSNLQL